MLCDGDSAPAVTPGSAASARLRILSRYHLENFFLDEITWAHAFRDIESEGHWLRDQFQVKEPIRQLAGGLASYATALAVTAPRRQDSGNIDIMPKDCHGRSLDDVVVGLLTAKAKAERTRIGGVLDDDQVRSAATDYYEALVHSIEADDDRWKGLVPGKPLLAQFASAAGVQGGRMKNLYLSAATIRSRVRSSRSTESSPPSRPCSSRTQRL